MIYLRKFFIGCMLIIVAHIPIRVNAQYLTITGMGQLTVRADEVCDAIPMMLEFLPTYKPNTKSITITDYFLYNDSGELKRYSQNGVRDGVNHITILYDEQGRITNFDNATFHYENNRIVECSHKDGFRCRFKYDSNGHLESATKGSWTYMFNVDKNGNITGLNAYYGTRKTSEISMSYDANGRIIAYLSDHRDYSWTYNKNGLLVSRREIGYSFSQGKMGGKTSDQEYRFEYGEDGNPVRRLRYKHGDITIVEGGSEYEYDYTLYPTKEELKKQEDAEKERIRKLEIEWQREDSIKRVAKYNPCRFLFNSDVAFINCVSKEIDAAEKEITELILKKAQYISSIVVTGKELRKEDNPAKVEVMQICDMCSQLNSLKLQYDLDERVTIEHIYNYTESALQSFVSGRSSLNKAYQKSKHKEYSAFLLSYINDN